MPETTDVPDLRSMSLPEALRWLREHGEPADRRPDVDTASLRRRFPRLADVSVEEHDIRTPHGIQPARVYRDRTARASARALVWVHGGAFIGGHLDMPESNWVALELASRGIPVLAADYSKCLGDVHFPVPSDDVLAAWEMADARAADLLGVDPGSLLLGGASAGGNLTAGVTARLRDFGAPVPAGLVLVYPVVHPNGPAASAQLDPASLHSQLTMNFVGSADRLADPHAFAALGSAAGFPPTLVLVCEHDGLRPSGEAFAGQLEAAGVAVELRIETGADHGHINEPDDPTALPAIEAIANWIWTLS